MDRRVGLVVALVGLIVLGGVVAGAGPGAGTGPSESATLESNASTTSPADGNGSVCVVLFYSKSCPHCADVESFLEDARETHDLRVRKYVDRTRPELFREYLAAYDVPSNEWGTVPTVFVGGHYAVGADASIDLIRTKLEAGRPIECPSEDAIAKGQAPDPIGPGSLPGGDGPGSSGDLGQCGGDDEASSDAGGCQSSVGSRTDLTTVAGLAGLAASDSINPCALAVLLILLTTISARAGGNARRVLAAGLSFALAIFLTYFVMGVLLIQGLRSVVDATTGTIDGLYAIVGALAIVLGLLNLKDWYAHGAGGFVLEVPVSWRPAMQRYLTRPLWERASVVVGAFVAGVAVSAFLLPCTSGPYFVAGGILADLPWSRSLPLLAAYNVVFVLPMVAVTAVIAGGFVSVERISDWREENVERLHLVAGLVLLAIGCWMVVSSTPLGARIPSLLANPSAGDLLAVVGALPG
jgi:cytochrome c biogenesis protein CcdA/glutaredoxin